MAGKRATIYISEDNLTEWEQIEHKSEWVNDMLSGSETGFEKKVKKVITDNMQMIVEALRGYYS